MLLGCSVWHPRYYSNGRQLGLRGEAGFHHHHPYDRKFCYRQLPARVYYLFGYEPMQCSRSDKQKRLSCNSWRSTAMYAVPVLCKASVTCSPHITSPGGERLRPKPSSVESTQSRTPPAAGRDKIIARDSGPKACLPRASKLGPESPNSDTPEPVRVRRRNSPGFPMEASGTPGHDLTRVRLSR